MNIREDSCFEGVPLARVYHGPKDDLVGDLFARLYPRASIIRRLTGDIRSTALGLLREPLREFIEANKGSGKILWISSHKIAAGDVDAVLRSDALVFNDLMSALQNGPQPGSEPLWCRRLLATLLYNGILEWRVVRVGEGMFHEKGAILDDRCGHRIFLSGSWNETLQAYTRNVERIDVHRPSEEEARCREALNWFEELWHGRVKGMECLPVKSAIDAGWIHQQEDERWIPFRKRECRPELWTPELLYLYLQDKLPQWLKDPYLGVLVDPRPHQVHVYNRVISRPPIRFLLADEVGLGKTIEAAMVLSTLSGSGYIRRVLILAPKNVLHQWQEELWEKFQLDSWILNGGYWTNHDKTQRADASKPLFAYLPGTSPQIVLVSRSLAMRKERRDDFLSSIWDMVILDEAHRARSRMEGGLFRPNNLLRILNSLVPRTDSLLLLTATPVQLRLTELHDLLQPLGLPEKWSRADQFKRFIEQMGENDPDWAFLIEMAKESEEYYTKLYNISTNDFNEDLLAGIKYWEGLGKGRDSEAVFRELLNYIRTKSIHEIEALSRSEKDLLMIALYRMTPMYQLVCRNTRELLRRYRERGVITDSIPDRKLSEPIEVHYTPEESRIYNDVTEKYIKPIYKKYSEAGLPGHSVGFVLAIYAKRAASSWYGLKRSLESRRNKLVEALRRWDSGGIRLLFGSIAIKELLNELGSEEEQETLSDGYEELEEEAPGPARYNMTKAREAVEEELEKVEDLLTGLEELTGRGIDTKKEMLSDFVEEEIKKRNGIVIFSQFKDTIDDLGDFLIKVRGDVAKYHGGGGEFWDGACWKLTTKQEIERGVREGRFKILIATDAASEGLNLQSSDAVVNYDLPWNPMRIEQRIGRIDRLNQSSPEIGIFVILPPKTIEDEVYVRCVERIGLFKKALGPLQPILLESYITKAVLEGEDIGKAIDAAIDSWEAARKHTMLLEEALAGINPEQSLEQRRRLETKTLEDLLRKNGFTAENGCWIKDGLRVAVNRWEKGAETLIATPNSALFGGLMAELGPPPEELQANEITYKVINCGDRRVLAGRSEGSGWFIIRNLAEIDGQRAHQIGIEEKQIQDYVVAKERQLTSAIIKFREQQRSVRKREWGVQVVSLLKKFIRLYDGSLEKTASMILKTPVLNELMIRYEDKEVDFEEIKQRLRDFMGDNRAVKGKKPSRQALLSRAKELLEWRV